MVREDANHSGGEKDAVKNRNLDYLFVYCRKFLE